MILHKGCQELLIVIFLCVWGKCQLLTGTFKRNVSPLMTVQPESIPQVEDRTGGCVAQQRNSRDRETHPSRSVTQVISLGCCFVYWNLSSSGKTIGEKFLPTSWRPLKNSLLWVKVSILTFLSSDWLGEKATHSLICIHHGPSLSWKQSYLMEFDNIF